MVLKASVVNLEVKKPAGTREKVSGQIYQEIQPAPATGLSVGLGLNTIRGPEILAHRSGNFRFLAQAVPNAIAGLEPPLAAPWA